MLQMWFVPKAMSAFHQKYSSTNSVSRNTGEANRTVTQHRRCRSALILPQSLKEGCPVAMVKMDPLLITGHVGRLVDVPRKWIMELVCRLVCVLDLCETSTTIVLRTAATLFVTEVLASTGSEEACRTAQPDIHCPQSLAFTHQHAPHFPRFVASWTDYPELGKAPPVLSSGQAQWTRSAPF